MIESSRFVAQLEIWKSPQEKKGRKGKCCQTHQYNSNKAGDGRWRYDAYYVLEENKG